MITRTNQHLALYKIILPVFIFILTGSITAQNIDSEYVASHFNKGEYMIPMRDGVKLFTVV